MKTGSGTCTGDGPKDGSRHGRDSGQTCAKRSGKSLAPGVSAGWQGEADDGGYDGFEFFPGTRELEPVQSRVKVWPAGGSGAEEGGDGHDEVETGEGEEAVDESEVWGGVLVCCWTGLRRALRRVDEYQVRNVADFFEFCVGWPRINGLAVFISCEISSSEMLLCGPIIHKLATLAGLFTPCSTT